MTGLLLARALGSVLAATVLVNQPSRLEVSGRVTDAASGRVVAAATVTVQSLAPGEPLLTVKTAVDGTYHVADLPDTEFRITVTAPEFLEQLVLQEPNVGLRVATGVRHHRLDFALQRTGAIRGRITLADGTPAAKVVVRVGPVSMGSDFLPGRSGTATTDVSGQYVVSPLVAGEYIVDALFVRTMPEPPDRFYFPGTVQRSEAASVVLEAGATVRDIDIPTAPTTRGVVSGTISGVSDGAKVFLRLIDTASQMTTSVQVNNNEFTLRSVVIGRYALWAESDDATAIQVIDVMDSHPPVHLVLESSGSVSGTIQAAGRPVTAQIRATYVEDDERIENVFQRADTTPDGQFELKKMLGSYVFTVAGLPRDWTITAVTVNGHAVDLDGPHVTLSSGEQVENVVIEVGPSRSAP